LEALGVAFDRIGVPNHDRRPVIEASGGKYYQVPLLVHGGSPVMESSPDSLDIARYVDRTWGVGRLFPKAWAGLHETVVEFIEDCVEGVSFKLVDPAYLDTVADPVARMMTIRHKERKFGKGCVERWKAEADALRAELEGLLSRSDARLAHAPHLFGEAPVYADFALYGIIGNLTYRNINTLPA
jgi:glutathione S-transferase